MRFASLTSILQNHQLASKISVGCGDEGTASFLSFSGIKIWNCHSTPVRFIHAPLNIRMKARMWPIHNVLCPAMFYGVPMNIIAVAHEVVLIPNEMFPKTPLP